VYCFIEGSYLVTRKTFRRAIFESWNGQCAYCSTKADTLDHVIPKSHGGFTVTENLVPACGRCNGAKSNKDWITWYRKQAWYCIEKEIEINRWVQSSRRCPET